MKKRNYLLILVLVAALLFSTVTPTLAAKKRVWNKAAMTTTARNNTFSVSARLTGWKQYLNVSFKGLRNTKGVNYELIYSSNGIDQGAGGRIEASENSVTKSLFLGTCSYRVCTAHKNISNVLFRVSYQTTGGQNITKKYRIRY